MDGEEREVVVMVPDDVVQRVEADLGGEFGVVVGERLEAAQASDLGADERHYVVGTTLCTPWGQYGLWAPERRGSIWVLVVQRAGHRADFDVVGEGRERLDEVLAVVHPMLAGLEVQVGPVRSPDATPPPT